MITWLFFQLKRQDLIPASPPYPRIRGPGTRAVFYLNYTQLRLFSFIPVIVNRQMVTDCHLYPGSGGGTRTPIIGTKNQGPTIRRPPIITVFDVCVSTIIRKHCVMVYFTGIPLRTLFLIAFLLLE